MAKASEQMCSEAFGLMLGAAVGTKFTPQAIDLKGSPENFRQIVPLSVPPFWQRYPLPGYANRSAQPLYQAVTEPRFSFHTTHAGHVNHLRARRNNSRCSRSSSFASRLKSRTSARSSAHSAPGLPFRAALAFPSGVFGPVDFSHGRHVRINAACRARLSGVQPFAMMLLQ